MKKESKPEIRQYLKPTIAPFLKIKLGYRFALKEKEVVEFIKQIEETEEFQELLRLKIIQRCPISYSHISIKPLSDYDYKDELFLPLVSLS
ncbi:MAG: hypothetical protein RMJ67_03585, partial [Elusimicrobiota bacterium]|nr:hypothetical protein [Endomicrobiia bacterium]MDW8165573.1 hypothetical protein [Elusimicrobiota bacterium]